MSRRRDVLVVADEVYHLLHYGDPAAAADVGLRRSGADRVDRDVLEDPGAGVAARLGARITGATRRVSPARASSRAAVASIRCRARSSTAILEEGWQADFLRELRSTYGRRVRDDGRARCESTCPAGSSYDVPDGGYFFWLTLPAPMDAAEVRERAARAGLDFRHGALFSSRGGLPRHLRLSFAYYDDGEIVEGVRRLGRVLGPT